ncbi:MAG TPA: TonB-dependent receptor, partial [Pyrinomonadaceae bacterium]|nr:TonB-dependent receptor [Pyrinomonadaceae bacterium]
MKFATWTVLLVGLSATCLAGVPQGQQKPSVYGKVMDPSKTPVRGVEVTARNISTNETKSVTTDEQGHYEISGLRDGEYRLNFKRDGFQRGERQASVRADLIPVVVDKILRPAPPETGGLSGVVEDANGAAVSGAFVIATNQQTGATLTGTTDADGFYYLAVPAGSYRLEVEVKGFKKYETDVVVSPSQAASVEVALVLGPVTEAVTVAAGATLIDEATPLGQTVVVGQQIAELPLQQRNFTLLAGLTPGVTRAASINGGRPDQTNISLDGMDNNDRSVGGGVAEGRRPGLPLEAIREVRVDPGLASGLDRSSDFAAEQGRSSGGTVSVVTKSGTNELHGSAFYFHRNS